MYHTHLDYEWCLLCAASALHITKFPLVSQATSILCALCALHLRISLVSQICRLLVSGCTVSVLGLTALDMGRAHC